MLIHMASDADRARRLWKLYGLTLHDYDLLAAHQGNRCAICHTAPKAGKNLAVDHDHAIVAKVPKAKRTPEVMRTSVRGLLCWLCNHRRIGRGATASLMFSAGRYLQESHSKAQCVLTNSSTQPATSAS